MAIDMGQSPSQPCVDAKDAIEASTDEKERLATLYAPGQTLWRVRIPHFTPWDWNWGWGPPSDAIYPNGGKPEQDELLDDSSAAP